jgi:hypothetical protein
MQPSPMARLDWDRLRRMQPLDGAGARVDPDGTVLWERDVGAAREDGATSSSGFRRLRAGVIVRRARELRQDDDARAPEVTAPPLPPRAAIPFNAIAWVECPRCRARVPRGKLLLHARAACKARG